MINKIILSVLLFLPIAIQSAEVLSPDAQLVKAVKDCNLDKVNEALNKGANVNQSAYFVPYVETLLHYAAKSLDKRYIEIVKTLIEKNADIFARTPEYKTTPLHLVAHAEVVNLLVMAGANVNDVANGKNTALHHVSRPDVARALLIAKANVNALDIERCPPLVHSGIFGRVEVVKVLLEYGADTTLRNINNRSIIYQINRSYDPRKFEIINIIEDHDKLQAQMPQILEETAKFFASNRDQFNFTEPLVKIITQYLIQNKL